MRNNVNISGRFFLGGGREGGGGGGGLLCLWFLLRAVFLHYVKVGNSTPECPKCQYVYSE